jgi:prolyl-tRNA synthetase
MGLKAIPMEAETGPIGGNLSHEFIILADTGESAVYCHRDYLDFAVPGADVDYEGDLEPIVQAWTRLYAATDEKHDPGKSPPPEQLLEARGIEVGHIFYFGTKYSEPLRAHVSTPDGGQTAVHMGSYGIGVSRLVGAIIEASHDEAGIIWPEAVAPFKVGLINLKASDAACCEAADRVYAQLRNAGLEVLYDDREVSPGIKFAEMDLIGLPWQLVIGPRGVGRGIAELKRRAGGERHEIAFQDAVARVAA